MASDLHSVVTFNVGGNIYTTLRETLLKEGNSRLALIARGLLVTARDSVSGAYVIDRDPKYFQIVLNWLRDGWCLLPKAAEERRELLQEVRYYQLTGFEGWLRTQELLAETGAPQAQELNVVESPRLRTHTLGTQPQPQHLTGSYLYPSYTGYQGYASPASMPPAPASPRAAATATGVMGTIRGMPSPWTSPTSGSFATGTGRPATAAATTSFPPHSHHTHLHCVYPHPANQPQHQYTHTQQPPPQYPSTRIPPGSPPRTSPAVTAGGGLGGSGGGAALSAWGSGAGAGPPGPGSAIASLREAFMAATGPQRPAPHVAPYSLPAAAADESGSWTSKYLRGNEGLRELVNTLLELAFLAPHRALQSGKSHVSVSVACGHGQEASLVGSKEDHMRSKLLEVRVRGALGWSFELTLRPSSDVALWDKYGGVAAGVQDNWFVLGAILKDQFGVVLEEDAAARPACVACRRTCLAITLNRIY